MDKVVYNMPFAKVDESKRIVSGFATLNNVDRQADIVTTEASVKAFSAFRGNIREQHSKIAAGKMLSFGVEQFFDRVANKVYDGIFVRAYISKGAPETWEKVLDGTLTGFSIGGEINEFDTVDLDGNTIRVIKDYDLAELSLVDNPANTLANVVSIEKAHDFFSNMADNIDNEKELNDMARTTKSNEAVVEPVAEEVVTEEVAEVAPEAAVEAPEETVEAPKAELADETSTKSEGTDEQNISPITEADSSSDAKVLADAIKEINSLIQETNTKTADAFSLLVEQLKELKETSAANSTKMDAVQQELVGVKSTVSEFDKRVESVEADTAVRKSGDLGEVAQVTTNTQKSLWGGAFLTADL